MSDRIKSLVIPITILASTLIFTPTILAQGPSQSSPAGQVKSCQVREEAIKNRMTHLTKLATDMMTKFDNHATKVEKYYTDKILSAGKTVSNYDSLVSDISIKKAAVQSALTTAQNDVNSFSCADGHPKQDMTQFRKDMQDVKKALKDYRTSIKNLIVAVRTAAGAK